MPGLNDLRLVTGIDMLNDFPKHVHSDFVAGIITAGTRYMSFTGGDITFSEGEIFIINPCEPHSLHSSGETHSYRALVIPHSIIKIAAADLNRGDLNISFESRIGREKDASARFNELIDILSESDSQLEIESALFSFIEYLIRYHSTSVIATEEKKINNCVRIAEEYIDKNFREQITLQDLSEITGVSPFHLNRSFSSETGISPHSYQIHRRIESSKRLLLGGYSISYVSAESGFTDQSHFTKFFKKVTGTTPGRFLMHNKKGD